MLVEERSEEKITEEKARDDILEIQRRMLWETWLGTSEDRVKAGARWTGVSGWVLRSD